MYTDISMTKLTRTSQEIKFCEENLKREYIELEDAISMLRHIESESINEVIRKLRQQRDNLYENIRKTQMLRMILEKVVDLYKHYEGEIIDYEERTSFIVEWSIYDMIDLNLINSLLKKNNIRFK